jgi:hypothetical protein
VKIVTKQVGGRLRDNFVQAKGTRSDILFAKGRTEALVDEMLVARKFRYHALVGQFGIPGKSGGHHHGHPLRHHAL